MTNFGTLRPGVMDIPEGSRLLILDYYDGMSEGLLQFGKDGPVLFLSSDDAELLGNTPRTFLVEILPSQIIDDCVRLFAELGSPTWPVWFPTWQFEDDRIRIEVEVKLDQLLDQRQKTDWEITCPSIEKLHRVTLKQTKGESSLARTA